MVIRARCILPLADPPIENGAIVTNQGRIQWIGRWNECSVDVGNDVVDLGEVALTPGLINAHCHLDYTNMAGKIPPSRDFPDWVKTILSFKAHWSFSEYAESWLRGARMLVNSGTTTVADIEAVPELPPETWKATPLRLVSFFELTGVKSQRDPDELLREAIQWRETLPNLPGKESGLSPHALYSTTPELMRKSASLAREQNILLTTHLAESEAEFQMYRDAGGPFFDWLKGQRNMTDCGHRSPIQLAYEYGLLQPNLLSVHVNYLAPGDADLLARAGSSVAHCPRSHDYFQHAPFPYAELTKAGVSVCLGTDSLASSRKMQSQEPELNLWDEMRLFAQRHSTVSPKQILSMVTINAARALHKEDELGVLRLNFHADIAALTYSGPVNEARIYEELLYNGSVREVFIGAEQVRTP
ncbi:MAG TPA: amidohydrolase family protein [Candidatus Kapabacteria bacterium]|nr:amidohydrolase family protein [Candidatus Kapabacteria bacterium]